MEQLRLSNISQDSDVYSQIDAALEEVNIEFYDRLGLTGMAVLIALPEAEGALDTLDKFTAALSVVVYRRLTKILLMKTLVMMFKDGSASLLKEWNSTGAFRNASQLTLNRQIKVETKALEKLWPLLDGTRAPGDATGNFESLISELSPLLRIVGGSVWTTRIDEWAELRKILEAA